MKRLALFLVLSLLAPNAGASDLVGVNAGIEQGFGINSYRHTNAYLALGLGSWSVAPEFITYDNNLGAPARTIKGRLGYDNRWMGFGVTGGTTFRQNGYSNVMGGADVAFTISALGEDGIRRIGGSGRGGAPVGKGIARVDFGGGLLTTAHKQDTMGRGTDKLTQSEIHGFVGASVLGAVLVSGRVSRWVYNEKPQNRGSVPAAMWTPTPTYATYAGSYQQSSFHARAEVPIFPMVRPFTDYTFVKFEPLPGGTRPGDNRAFGVGVRVGLELVAAEARYQHINVTSGQDQNYCTLGAQLRF